MVNYCVDLRRTTPRSPKFETSIFKGRNLDPSKVDTSIFEDRQIDPLRTTHRSSKVDPSISEGRNIDFRWSKHRSSKVDTSISDCRSIDLRRSKYRSSKVDTSISEGRNIDLRRSKHRSPKFEGHHRILFTTPLHRFLPPKNKGFLSRIFLVCACARHAQVVYVAIEYHLTLTLHSSPVRYDRSFAQTYPLVFIHKGSANQTKLLRTIR